MPQPNVSSGPSRSTTVISCEGSRFLSSAANWSPPGPPPRILTFIRECSRQREGFARSRRRVLAAELEDGRRYMVGLDELAGFIEAGHRGHGVFERLSRLL